MKIINLHLVSVTIKLEKEFTNMKKDINMVHSKVRRICELCDYTSATEYLIKVHRLS